jgi:hypothetical protein
MVGFLEINSVKTALYFYIIMIINGHQLFFHFLTVYIHYISQMQIMAGLQGEGGNLFGIPKVIGILFIIM